MADSMRAFVIKKVGETEMVEKPIPEPGPEEAIVRTTAALICTSDVHTVRVRCRYRTGARSATSRSAWSRSSAPRSPASRSDSGSPSTR